MPGRTPLTSSGKRSAPSSNASTPTSPGPRPPAAWTLFRHRPTYRLWLVASQGGGRLQEWRARAAAEPTWRGKAAITLRAPLVNTDHLAMLLGRRPTRREVAYEFVDRFRRAAVEVAARARRERR
jgi:hypothetical protein